ncbi:hypothetical protein MSG28_001293 [Choristoneura fumiferana]|uniref:Uncharacterized protein n=1 Tax=Choristoneura fumiferana TaxID=7141 RepID=A0ACC0K4Y1_CHOFU|nr:hypothetical protein MSG28_001293 [Choristoneura fumiferana]
MPISYSRSSEAARHQRDSEIPQETEELAVSSLNASVLRSSGEMLPASLALVPPPTMSEKRVERVTRNEWASSEKRRVFVCYGRLLAPLDSLVRGGRQADIAERVAGSRWMRKAQDRSEWGDLEAYVQQWTCFG